MNKKWKKTRSWEMSKNEIKFEELLKNYNYTIKGYKEYNSKTDYLLSKDGVDIEWSIYHDNKIDVVGLFKSLENSYNLKVEILKLEKEI